MTEEERKEWRLSLVELFKFGQIDENKFRRELAELGYNATEIQEEVDIHK